MHGAIGFSFASHWLKNRRESFRPIAERSNRNHVITFGNHLETVSWEPITSTMIFMSLFSLQIGSPLRAPLLKFLIRYPANTVDYFLLQLSGSQMNRLFMVSDSQRSFPLLGRNIAFCCSAIPVCPIAVVGVTCLFAIRP